MAYPPEIVEICSKAHADAHPAGTAGVAANFVCGSVVRFYVDVDEDTRAIKELEFRSNGCGYMIAGASELARVLRGKPLADLHGLDEAELIEQLHFPSPAERRECINACVAAIRNAFAEYRRRRVQEFKGETALICTCFGVSEDTIENVVSRNPATVESVGIECNAGTGCGSCQMMIQEIIDSSGA